MLSALARAEVLRALLRGEPALAAGRQVLSRVDLVRGNDPVLSKPAPCCQFELRSLDALHLATAARVGADLAEIVTYDQRMAAAAPSLGYKVSSPT
jgi:uncharacterized protein